MGIRYRKSIKLAPGVKLHLGKKNASVSIGAKGAHKTFSTTGRTTTSVGIPGTGISYVESTNKSTKKKNGTHATEASNTRSSRPKKPFYKKWWFWLIIVIGIGGVIGDGTQNNNNQEFPTASNEAIISTEATTEPPTISETEPTTERTTESTEKKEIIVYITDTGTKYHRSGCRHLDESEIPISLEKAISRGFTPCGTCNPPTK